MKIEATGSGKANIILSRTEWTQYGNSMGWTPDSPGHEDIKTASSPSIRLTEEDGKHVLSMNHGGWKSIGKKAGFYDDDDLDDFGGADTVDGDDDYSFDGQDRNRPMNFGDESLGLDAYDGDDLLDDDLEDEEDYLDGDIADMDVEESEIGKDDAVQEAMENSLEALSTALYGIQNGETPPQVAPQLILSALDPITEFRDVDTQEDPIQELTNYLASPPRGDAEKAVMDAIREALDVAGIDLDGGIEL